MADRSTMQHFTATPTKAGRRTIISIPFDPNVTWGEKARHHVRGTVNGHAWRGELGQEDAGYFIALGEAWLRDNSVLAGAPVDVVLAPEGPQSANVPPDIALALQAAPQARAFFDELPTFYRNNFMRWINSAKRAETRAKRIEEMVNLLNAGQRER